MPVGTRTWTEEERRILEAFRKIPFAAGGPYWSFREELVMAVRNTPPTSKPQITIYQAEKLRAVVWALRSKFPFSVEAFSRSSVGQFPYTPRDKPAPRSDD